MLNREVMTPDSTPTLRLRAQQRVIMVHDDLNACTRLIDRLREAFIVRVTTSVAEMEEQLTPIERVTAIVCVSGKSVRAYQVHHAFTRAGGKPERIVYVAKDAIADSSRAIDDAIGVVRRVAAHVRS